MHIKRSIILTDLMIYIIRFITMYYSLVFKILTGLMFLIFIIGATKEIITNIKMLKLFKNLLTKERFSVIMYSAFV